MVARTHLNVAIYVYCLYCFNYYREVRDWSQGVLNTRQYERNNCHLCANTMKTYEERVDDAHSAANRNSWPTNSRNNVKTYRPTNIHQPSFGTASNIPENAINGKEGSRSIHLLILNRRQTGVGGQVHAPAALPPGKSPGTYCTRGRVSPKAGLNGYGEERTSFLHHGLKPGPSSS